MTSSGHGGGELAAIWRDRFGEPPPLLGSDDLMRALLRDYARTPSARLSLEAVLLQREAEAACARLHAARQTSRRLIAEARERLLQAPARLAEALA
jgi:hypothetical protein